MRGQGRAVLLGLGIIVAIFGCIAVSITLPLTFSISYRNTQSRVPTPSAPSSPIPTVVIPTHHTHPHLHCIFSQTQVACEEAARRHGKPGLSQLWISRCPHTDHKLYNTTGATTNTSQCISDAQLPSGCVFWTTNDTVRSGFVFVEFGQAQCGETITLPHENVSHTVYCVPTCHIQPIVVTTTTAETTTSVATTTSTTPETTPTPTTSEATTSTAPTPTTSTTPETTPAPTAPETTSTTSEASTSTAPAPTTTAPAPSTSTTPETTPAPTTSTTPTPTTSTAPETTSEASTAPETTPTPTTSEATTSTAPTPTTSTAPETTSEASTAPETTPAPTTSAPETTTSAPATSTAPVETEPPAVEISYGTCKTTEQRYCVKNKTVTAGAYTNTTLVNCECEECARVTGCKCGSYEGYFHPGPPPSNCIGALATSPCELPNMTVACDTVYGQRSINEQFVCGDGSANSRTGKQTYFSCPFICLTEQQVKFFEPTFDGTCNVTRCCGNWRMHPVVDPETGLVIQCRAPEVGTGIHIPWSDIFAVGLPQPEQCKATCGNTSTQCTDFHGSETCGNYYITGPGFSYVELPNDTQPGCTQPLPVGTVCEKNIVYDTYPEGRCIRGCEIMVHGHCMSLVTLQHPDIPKDYTFTQSATITNSFWGAVVSNHTFRVNITYGNLCGPNDASCFPVTVGSTTCQPLTCCNVCGEKSQEYLSQKRIQPWLCEHVKAPCQYFWPDGTGSDAFPPLSCEDSVLNSTIIDVNQSMGHCNGACDATMGDSCAVDGLCVQHDQSGRRSRCMMQNSYSYVLASTQASVVAASQPQKTIWLVIDTQPRGFVCTSIENAVHIVPFPFQDSLGAGTYVASFEQHDTLVVQGQYVFTDSGTVIVPAANVTLTNTASTTACMPPPFQCNSHSISFGFSNAAIAPQQYAFALNGSIPLQFSDCLLCFVTKDFAVGKCTTAPTSSVHVNISVVSALGCSALGPCDINNCEYQCLHENATSSYKGSLESCDFNAPACQGLDGDLGFEYPCLLTPKQNNWAFDNRASSCSIGLWGTVKCADENAIPSLTGAFCMCKGGYQLLNGICTVCPVGQNSNPGGVCLNIYPTGELATLELVNQTVQYVGGQGQYIAGVTLYGGDRSWIDTPLNMQLINYKFQQVYNNTHNPQLYIGQGSTNYGVVCSVNMQTGEICVNKFGGRFSGQSSTWVSPPPGTLLLGTEVGQPYTTAGGCPSLKNMALYCRTPDSIKVCSEGTNITSQYYALPPIPCNGSYQYVLFTGMVTTHNTPGIGCDYVVINVDWDGTNLMYSLLVSYSCYGNAWKIGDTVVPMGNYYPDANWHLDLKVTAIKNQQPIFIPIKP